MMDQAPILIIIFPLMFALLTPLLGWVKKSLCYPWALLSLALSAISSIITLRTVLFSGVIHYKLGNWDPPWGIEYVIDHLNASILVLITTIGLLIAITSKRLVIKENPGKETYFYTLLLLQITGFLGIVITGDLFNLYVFVEIASLSGYALIAIGEDHAPFASFRYIIMGTIGACFYLIGVGYLYSKTGTLNMADMAKLLPALYSSNVIITAFVFMVIGVAIKMALPPLHAWLSDAYTLAPSATSSLVAPLMTKISVYVLIRILISVFDPSFSITTYPVNEFLGWVAVFGILFAGIMALAQRDLKRMLTYLIMAEIGYIIIGIASSNRLGFTGAVLHIINDVFMMACLFTAVGAIYYRTGSRNIDDLRFLHRKMPITLGVLVVGALSIIGIPPFCGFFSKWYLILGAIESEKWVYLAVLIISSLINAVLIFRILEKAYIEPREEDENHVHHENGKAIINLNEAPLTMLIPMMIIAVGIIGIGIFSSTIVKHVISHAIPSYLF